MKSKYLLFTGSLLYQTLALGDKPAEKGSALFNHLQKNLQKPGNATRVIGYKNINFGESSENVKSKANCTMGELSKNASGLSFETISCSDFKFGPDQVQTEFGFLNAKLFC
jgi:hypothetical protein